MMRSARLASDGSTMNKAHRDLCSVEGGATDASDPAVHAELKGVLADFSKRFTIGLTRARYIIIGTTNVPAGHSIRTRYRSRSLLPMPMKSPPRHAAFHGRL